MASITKDSYDETKGNTKVLYQKGRDLVDFELNEAQDIQRVSRSRQADAAFMAGASLLDFTALQPTGTGASNDITIASGRVYVNGESVDITGGLLSALGGTLTTNNSGSDRYDYVYLELVESEISASTDPDMAISSLGETARRRRIVATWQVSEGSVPPASASGPLRSATKRITVARLFRADTVAAIGADDVMDIRPITLPSLLQLKSRLILYLTDNATIEFNAFTNTLNIRDEGATSDLTEGARIGTPDNSVVGTISGQFTLTDGDALVWRNPKLLHPEGTAGELRLPGNPLVSATDGLDDNTDFQVVAQASIEATDLVVAYREGLDCFLFGGGKLLNSSGVSSKVITSYHWYGEAGWLDTLTVPGSDFQEVQASASWLAGATGAVAQANDRLIILPLNLPRGAVITAVDFLLTPADVRAAAGDRVVCELRKVDANFDAPSIAGSVVDQNTDDGTATVQVVPLTIVSGAQRVVDNVHYIAEVRSGLNLTVSDELHAVKVTYNAPGT